MTPPRWSDEAAVAEWVGRVIDDAQAEIEREFSDPYYDHPPLKASEVLADMERAAVAAAEDGNFEPLGSMMENPLFKGLNGVLGQRAMALISAKLRGTFKARRGPRRQSIMQRELKPEHWAANEVDQIARVLGQHYQEKGIRERAIGIAAARAKISRRKLETELRSRHRLRR